MPNSSYQVVVIGAGIAGLAAATEAARRGFKTALFDDGLLGGLITNVGAVQGQPDAPAGAELAGTMLGEALEAAVDYRPGAVTELTAADGRWRLPGHGVAARRVILATGARLRRLEVPGEDRLTGRGVSQCAYCDGGLYRGRDVAVVGGGDAAFQEALHLAELCATVTMILRGARPRARPGFVARAEAIDTIRFRRRVEVREIVGDDGVDALRLYDHESGAGETLPVAAVFPFIGLVPRTELAPAAAGRGGDGGLIVDADMRTDQAGLFAIGAARSDHGGQLAHAMTDARTAAQSIHDSTSPETIE